MDNNLEKNSISAFFKAQSDIIALVLIVVLAVAGQLLHDHFLTKMSVLIALLNFLQVYFGSRREKQDERVQHIRNLAGYHTVIAIFFLASLMAPLISILHRINWIGDIDVRLCCRIIVWSIGFIYAVAYSIIKRLQ